MAAGATVSDPNRAIAGSRGVFTFLRNGSCNQSGMVMENRHLASSKISRMEVYSDGSALHTTVGSYANISVRSGGTALCTVVNYGGYMMVSSGGTALDTELNSSGSMYLSPGATASGGEVHSYGRVYAYSNTEVNDFHVSYGGGLYGQGTSVTFNSIVSPATFTTEKTTALLLPIRIAGDGSMELNVDGMLEFMKPMRETLQIPA